MFLKVQTLPYIVQPGLQREKEKQTAYPLQKHTDSRTCAPSGALFTARTTPQPSQNLVEPSWNPNGTLVKPLWNLTSRTTPEPIWAETPQLSAVGENKTSPPPLQKTKNSPPRPNPPTPPPPRPKRCTCAAASTCRYGAGGTWQGSKQCNVRTRVGRGSDNRGMCL